MRKMELKKFVQEKTSLSKFFSTVKRQAREKHQVIEVMST